MTAATGPAIDHSISTAAAAVARAATMAADSGTQAAAGRALRMLAADPRCRDAFTAPGSLLRQALAPAARRYVAAADSDRVLDLVTILATRGYRTSVEAVGEEARDPADIARVVKQYLTLLTRLPPGVQLGFDMSNVGLLISRELARENIARILDAAAGHSSDVVISMERSEFVDDILTVFGDLAREHANIGITVQAHLHRTDDDLDRILAIGGKIRMVKGVYAEPAEVALPRGPELDERYLRLVGRVVDHRARLAVATHDADLLTRLAVAGLLAGAEEIEMLHGVQPALLRRFRDAGHACRVYLTYGENWWLHLLHRLAEYPPMIATALADIADPHNVVFGSEY